MMAKRAGPLSRRMTSFPAGKRQKNLPLPLRQTAVKWYHLSKDENHKQISYHHILKNHNDKRR